MPELPEVQTTATSLQPLLNQTVEKVSVFQPKLRWAVPDDLVSLVDYQLVNIERRAKNLILTFKGGAAQKNCSSTWGCRVAYSSILWGLTSVNTIT